MKVAFLGTGLMGGLMAQRLIYKGFELRVWNRTVSKTDILKSKGAKIAPNPTAAIDESDTIITMLSDFNAVSSVLGNRKNSFQGKTVIQMCTIAPGESKLLLDKVIKLSGEYIESPVLGGISNIPDGKLIPMVGSSNEQFNKWKDFLGNFGKPVHYMGEVGKGAAAKLACNQLIAGLVTSFAMSLGYVESQGIDTEEFMSIIRPSSYYAPAFDRKLESMLKRDYSTTNFSLKNLLKDASLALHEFSESGVNIITLEAIQKLLTRSVNSNLGDLDYAALYNVVFPER